MIPTGPHLTAVAVNMTSTVVAFVGKSNIGLDCFAVVCDLSRVAHVGCMRSAPSQKPVESFLVRRTELTDPLLAESVRLRRERLRDNLHVPPISSAQTPEVLRSRPHRVLRAVAMSAAVAVAVFGVAALTAGDGFTSDAVAALAPDITVAETSDTPETPPLPPAADVTPAEPASAPVAAPVAIEAAPAAGHAVSAAPAVTRSADAGFEVPEPCRRWMPHLAAHDVPAWMISVAWRESRCQPDAHNGDRSTGDDSYGLFQINALGGLREELVKTCGISNPQVLLDGETNIACTGNLYRRYGYKPWDPGTYFDQ